MGNKKDIIDVMREEEQKTIETLLEMARKDLEQAIVVNNFRTTANEFRAKTRDAIKAIDMAVAALKKDFEKAEKGE